VSLKDPWMQLADIILENLEDWRLLVEAMEPKHPGSIIVLPATPSAAGNAVERFVVKREDLMVVLSAVHRRLRRMRGHLRRIYRLKWVKKRTHYDIADELNYGLRTVDRYISQIRACVAGVLASLGPEKLAGFWHEIGRIPGA